MERHNSQASIMDPRQTRLLRRENMIQFILALSDQQLVTGLAILIAGVSHQGSFTRYEWVAIHNLAWFSSTTHLATLDVLGSHFRSQRNVRAARTFGIIAFLLLLDYLFIIRALAAMLGGALDG